GILHSTEHQHHLRGRGRFEIGILAGGPERYPALVRCGPRHSVERRARLKAHRHSSATREVDDLLQARTARALGHQQAVHWMMRSQGLGYGVYAAQDRHQASGRMTRPLLNRLVKLAIAATSVISTT